MMSVETKVNYFSNKGDGLDPRTKLILSTTYTLILILSNKPWWLTLEFSFSILAILLLRMVKIWFRSLKLTIPMVVVVFLIALFSFNFETAISTSLRLLGVVSTFFLLFHTTNPEDLGNSLVKSGLPYEFAFILSSSLRFVPVITRKLRDIRDAQRSRGITLEGKVSDLKNYSALLSPLLIQSFRLSMELAEAMETRGFGIRERTFYREYRMRIRDYLLIAAGFLSLFLFLALS